MHPYCTRVLTAIVRGDTVMLGYELGLADGITLLSRRGLETDFSAFAEDEPAPVVDSRPKLDPRRPETRRYRAVFRYSNDECRQLSNEVVLTVP